MRSTRTNSHTQNDFARRYFAAIQEAWAPFAVSHRIIPFCTPVFERPTALVIGTNHSNFVDGGGQLSESIADALASAVPAESTFLIHEHKFARGLHEVCNRADIKIDDRWIGTNRCAVQTGPKGIQELAAAELAACQAKMDGLLRTFIAETKPRNVLLVGKYAIQLYYASAATAPIAGLEPRDAQYGGEQTRIIPIPHPSRATFWQPAADRLAECFVR